MAEQPRKAGDAVNYGKVARSTRVSRAIAASNNAGEIPAVALVVSGHVPETNRDRRWREPIVVYTDTASALATGLQGVGSTDVFQK